MKTRSYRVVLAICFFQLAGSVSMPRAVGDSPQATEGPAQWTSNSVPDGAGQDTGLPWANGRFVYEFSPKLKGDQYKTALFESVCSHLVDNTALHCVRHSEQAAIEDRDYVYVVDGFGDFSYVGRQGGRQVLGILTWNNPNIIAHEIKHALGWGHEQQQPDRDRFVDILFENIPPDKREAFVIHNRGNEGPYDFDSIMHYYPTDFALPAKKSIRVKPQYRMYQSVIGQRDHLSITDLQEIRDFYGDSGTEWCGISRKPKGRSGSKASTAGCPLVCRFGTDPTVGAWVPDEDCKGSGG